MFFHFSRIKPNKDIQAYPESAKLLGLTWVLKIGYYEHVL